MKLDLNALKTHPGERIPFAMKAPLQPSDFHEPITLNSPLYAEGWAVMLFNDVVDLVVKFKIELERPCSRCLAPIDADVELEERVALFGTDSLQLLSDAFSYMTDSSEIDLEPVLFSLLLSEFDPKPLCKSDCKGLCPSCGTDLNSASCRCGKQHDKDQDPRMAALAQWLDE